MPNEVRHPYLGRIPRGTRNDKAAGNSAAGSIMPAMADGVRVYTGTYDGVQVLSVQGERCEPVTHHFGGAIIGALAGCRQRPERVFAGMGDGLFRTDDAGT